MISFGPGDAALLTDLYELTMAASYHSQGIGGTATFDLFVRTLPEERNFLIACGVDEAITALEELRFTDDALEYLGSLDLFERGFLDYLGGLTFSGEVWAISEGEAAFEREPLVRVTAPIIEAQIIETFLINQVGYQTMVASKAARVALAAGGRMFVDFSLRRDHGADAGVAAARASFVAGASATSNLLAGARYSIPVTGTMAHSYVMAFDSEEDAFRAFAQDFPDRATLLIDTFDVEEGARRAAKVAVELAARGIHLQAVRIDSGDLVELSRRVRAILDDAGVPHVKVLVSGDLNEHRVAEIVASGAPLDGFGIGTQMGTSADAPYLGIVYKLVALEGGPRMKLSSGKANLPGRKQVYRVDDGRHYSHDVIALDDEPSEGRPLLGRVMVGGTRTEPPARLEHIRERCAQTLSRLPTRMRALDRRFRYDVRVSGRLGEVVRQLSAEDR